MKRFTHSLLATSMIIAATGMTAQASGINNEQKLTEVTAGDYSNRLAYDGYNRLSSVESLASKVTFDYSPATLDGEEYDMTMRISDPTGDIVCYLEIGDNGYISRSREIEEYMGEQAPYKTYTFGYDSEGHLMRVTEVGITEFSDIEFEYTDGNLVTSSVTDSRSTGSESAAKSAGIIDYDAFGFDDIEARYFQYAGLLGASAHSSDDTASVTDIMMQSPADKGDAYYSINGMRHGSVVKGINIIRCADGSVVKTLHR
ncbi:MAG: hypothetical protein K2K37_09480 [Muribaculaceae bacterium]|nr:hypothetical protein [Muribaculaceae bacterium]